MSTLIPLLEINQIGKDYNGSLQLNHDKADDAIHGIEAFTLSFSHSNDWCTEKANARFTFAESTHIPSCIDSAIRWVNAQLSHVVMNDSELKALCAIVEARMVHFM